MRPSENESRIFIENLHSAEKYGILFVHEHERKYIFI